LEFQSVSKTAKTGKFQVIKPEKSKSGNKPPTDTSPCVFDENPQKLRS
jgi:hypothetical protein